MMRRTNSVDDETIKTMLAERIAAGDFPSAVYVVAEKGRTRLSGALGDAVREPVRHAATLDTIYDLASLTKPLVTGLLCALLSERGALETERAVAHYLPEFAAREDKRDITVRQLLTHTSGLPAWRPLYLLTGGDRALALETIAAQPLEYASGTRVVYSDLGFITLGLLVERITRHSLAEFARQEIFAPLGLKRTFFNPARALQMGVAACESGGNNYERGMCGDAAGGAAQSFQWREDLIWGEVHDGNAHFLGGAAGHAGLFSDARETLRIAAQFLPAETRLLAPETCALFRTNMTAGLDEARSFAWQLAATKDSTASASLSPESFGHLGFTGTSCWIDPAHERIFILLTNRTHAARALPFVNINSVRRRFHTLAVEALEAGDTGDAR
ncbi:MAG TPA: serine hydrolase [Pyrinomonadaceae bacterium]|jgi:CubicO group peptidase (beta-lactamase class C family)|nr:serine hydrolase [Pyrinomonadaceae bacterium]